MRFFYAILLFICSIAANGAPTLSYTVLGTRYHNPELFTQGLALHEDHFYESSGLYNQSHWLIYPVQYPAATWAQMTGKAVFNHKFHRRYFAEGLTIFKDKVFVLTWNERKVFVFDLKNHEELKPMRYSGEGWGLTSNDQFLIRSDGSNKLYFHHPDNFKIEKTLEVKDNNKPIGSLNELEYAQGFIWANIWYEHKIIKIHPETGDVIGEMDFRDIVEPLYDNPEKVLNGIAWDEQRQGFWITGKWWPKMFLIQIK